MAYFEVFYRQIITKEGKRKYRKKTFDVERVESWEPVDEKHVNVTMTSGEKFILYSSEQVFSEMVISSHDFYGQLLTFNTN